MKPDQHYPLTVKEMLDGDIRRAIRKLESLKTPASMPYTSQIQKDVAAAYIKLVRTEVAEIAIDLLVDAIGTAAWAGDQKSNSKLTREVLRDAINDVMDDELTVAQQWADGELEDA